MADFDPAVETVTGIEISPFTKTALVFVAGGVCGLIIGLGVSALLAETKAPAPHVPTRPKVTEVDADDKADPVVVADDEE